NGAGKSTLLKLITGTAQPTTGSVHMTGRVAAMLELGMGFHPDFTGRQNAFMAGQLLGIGGEAIARLMPEIEAFAEIGDYIDQPVRVYSSGMQMRLAFSVATAIRPDILIVDEALSVGDAYFQHKSFDRIREFGKSGTTLLIVSHDKAAIQSICDRVILLNAGRLAMEGEPEAMMDYYNAMLADHQNQNVKQKVLDGGKVQTISGTGEVVLESVKLLDAQYKHLEVIAIGQPVILQVMIRAKEAIPELTTGFMIKDRTGQAVFGTNTHYLSQAINNVQCGETITLRFHFVANFGEGSYSVTIALHSAETHIMKNYEWRDLAMVFNVLNINKPQSVGTVWIPIDRLEVIR
ncbi:MAG: ABC transporter ATP-binding protein, partial [Acinetobacter sp.]|nr:ABC transporter ATP-binding protein [Acinetobacter sp.]